VSATLRAGLYGVASQFTGLVVVSVPGLAAETVRPMRARCWNNGVYIVGGDDSAATAAAGGAAAVATAAGTGATGVAATGRFLPLGDVLRESTAPPPFEVVTLTLPTALRPGETGRVACSFA
jgi:hypothetical protein